MPDQTNKRDGAEKPETGSQQTDDRLGTLGEALNRVRSKSAAEKSQGTSSVSGYGQAMKLSSEFIAGVLVGAGLGWGIDRVFDISPWGLIVFLMLGFGAGVLNVLRSAKLIEDPAERLNKKPPQD